MKKERAETLEVPLADAAWQDDAGREQNSRSSRAARSQSNVLELITRELQEPRRLNGVVIGKLVDFDNKSDPLVDFPANLANEPIVARSTMKLEKKAIGQEVALMFEEGDPCRPIVMGLIQHAEEGRGFAPEERLLKQRNPLEVEIDGERLVFTAQKEIVLRCGEASITLTRAGKILIRGTYVLNRSSGVNRIKGGSVQIN